MKTRGFARLALLSAIPLLSSGFAFAQSKAAVSPGAGALRLADGWSLQSSGKVAEAG